MSVVHWIRKYGHIDLAAYTAFIIAHVVSWEEATDDPGSETVKDPVGAAQVINPTEETVQFRSQISALDVEFSALAITPSDITRKCFSSS